MSGARGTASAKVILLGEHTVVYGEPAIAAAVDLDLHATLRPRGATYDALEDPKLRAAVEAALRPFHASAGDWTADIDSEIPIACGLGSSAALSVALVRAGADAFGEELDAADVLARATEVENVFHGTSSGIDVATSASGSVIWFERGAEMPVRPLVVGAPFDLVVALSGERRSTAEPVARLRARFATHPGLYRQLFALAGNFSHAGRGALATGDFETLGHLMDCAQGVLNGLGVSTPTLERLVAVARRAGALGAKLTGAGGGGAAIALAPENAPEVAAALEAEGFESFVTRIDAPVTEEVCDAIAC